MKLGDMVTMRARVDAGRDEAQAGNQVNALQLNRRALKDFHSAQVRKGYYFDLGNDYFVAAGCYLRQRNLRAALKAYRQGLEFDPNSINLLTQYGNCAILAGEFKKAFLSLQRSNMIYPFDEKVKKSLMTLQKKLKSESNGTSE